MEYRAISLPYKPDIIGILTKSYLPERIALFTGNYNHIADGVSLTLNRLVAYLEEQDVEVLVFGPTVEDPPVNHNGTLIPVPSISAPGRPEYRVSLFFPNHARRKMLDFKPDLIHVATPDLLGLQALLLGQSSGIPVVSSFHTNFASYLKYYGYGLLEPLLWKYLRWYYSRCRALFVPTPSMKEELQQRQVKTDLRIWSRGVEVDLFHPDKRTRDWREAWGISEEDKVVLFVSRLVWEKNLEVVKKVFGQCNELENVKTVIAGDGPAREELKKMLPATIFTGSLYGEQLAEAYAGSDLFFFPSDTETFGNVTLEAMSSGLPVVAADAAGNRSLVTQNVNGFLANAKDTEVFFGHLSQLIREDEMRNSMAVKSRQIAESYNWPKVMDELMQHYSRVLMMR